MLQVETLTQQEAVLDDENIVDEECSTSTIQTDNNRSEAEKTTPSTSSENRNLPSNSNKQGQKRRARNPLELQEASKHMATAFTTLNSVLQSTKNQNEHKKDEDACDLFCRLLATQLRDFSKDEQEDIMYEIHGLMTNKRRCRHQNIQATASFSRPSSSLSSYASQISSPEALSPNLVHHQASSGRNMQPTVYSHSPSQILLTRPSSSCSYSSQTLSQNINHQETSPCHVIVQSPELDLPILHISDNVEIVSQKALKPRSTIVLEAFHKATNNDLE